jgi:hypothetical protein
MRIAFERKRAGTKKNLAVKVLWKIIHQIKGFTLLIQIISFNFADIKQTGGLLVERPDKNGFAPKGKFWLTWRSETKQTGGLLTENHLNFKNLTFI